MTNDDVKRAHRERQEWIEELLALRDLEPRGKLVGIRLAHHRNDRTGKCYPSVGELARGTGLSESTTRRWLHELRRRGWVMFADNRGGKGKSTQYTLTKPRQSCDTLSAPKPGQSFDPLTRSAKGNKRAPKPSQSCDTVSTHVTTDKGCQIEPQRVSNQAPNSVRAVTPESVEPTESTDRAAARAPLVGGSLSRPQVQEESKEASKRATEEESKQVGSQLAEFVAAMKAKTETGPSGWAPQQPQQPKPGAKRSAAP